MKVQSMTKSLFLARGKTQNEEWLHLRICCFSLSLMNMFPEKTQCLLTQIAETTGLFNNIRLLKPTGVLVSVCSNIH